MKKVYLSFIKLLVIMTPKAWRERCWTLMAQYMDMSGPRRLYFNRPGKHYDLCLVRWKQGEYKALEKSLDDWLYMGW